MWTGSWNMVDYQLVNWGKLKGIKIVEIQFSVRKMGLGNWMAVSRFSLETQCCFCLCTVKIQPKITRNVAKSPKFQLFLGICSRTVPSRPTMFKAKGLKAQSFSWSLGWVGSGLGLVLGYGQVFIMRSPIAQYMLWPCVRMSVLPSVTSRCSTKLDHVNSTMHRDSSFLMPCPQNLTGVTPCGDA